jgi:hypothetical protein
MRLPTVCILVTLPTFVGLLKSKISGSEGVQMKRMFNYVVRLIRMARFGAPDELPYMYSGPPDPAVEDHSRQRKCEEERCRHP